MPGLFNILFPNLGMPRNQALDDLKPASVMINNSIPGLKPVVERENMTAGNPFKFVGDGLTRMMGGDPDAGVLDNVDPSRGGYIPNPVSAGFGAMGSMEKPVQSPIPSALPPSAVPPPTDIPGTVAVPPPMSNTVDTSGRIYTNYSDHPKQPVTTPVPEMGTQIQPYPQEALPTPPNIGAVPPPVIERRPSDITKAEIDRRNAKDFSKGGKDYDDDHNFWDVLRGAGLGALKGLANGGIGGALGGALAGGIGGAFDRNTDEKMGNEMHLAKLQPKYDEQYKSEQTKIEDGLNNQKRQTEIDINTVKPELLIQAELRKQAKDAETAKYNDLRLKQGKEKADNWLWAQEQLAKYRDGTLKVSQERLKQYQQIIDETERYNKVKDENEDADREVKTGIANNKLSFDKEKLDKTLQAADAKTKLTLVTQSLDKWKATNKDATPEQVAAAEAAIKKTVGLQ